jgi:hypothetical protein
MGLIKMPKKRNDIQTEIFPSVDVMVYAFFKEKKKKKIFEKKKK